MHKWYIPAKQTTYNNLPIDSNGHHSEYRDIKSQESECAMYGTLDVCPP